MQKDEQNEKIAEPAVAQKRVQKPTAQDWFEKDIMPSTQTVWRRHVCVTVRSSN